MAYTRQSGAEEDRQCHDCVCVDRFRWISVEQLALAWCLLPGRYLFYPSRGFCPHRHTLRPTLLGSYDPTPALAGRYRPAAGGCSSAVTVVAGITGLGAQARQGTGKTENRSCLLLAGAPGAGARPLVRAPYCRALGVAIGRPPRTLPGQPRHPTTALGT